LFPVIASPFASVALTITPADLFAPLGPGLGLRFSLLLRVFGPPASSRLRQVNLVRFPVRRVVLITLRLVRFIAGTLSGFVTILAARHAPVSPPCVPVEVAQRLDCLAGCAGL